MDKVKYTHIAFYNADWDTQLCKSLKEAEEFLTGHYDFDGTDEGFTEETVNGWDYIAEITHKSNYVVDDEKSNYEDEEEWPHDADTAGHIEIVPVKPIISPERLAEIIKEYILIQKDGDMCDPEYTVFIKISKHAYFLRDAFEDGEEAEYMQDSLINDLATELSKTLDIREKE